MKNQLASPSHASAADRALAAAAITAIDWDSAYHASRHTPATMADTKAELERSLATPLQHIEPKLDGPLSARVKAHLSTIGAKIRPDLSPDQALSWVNAMTIALADLPPTIAAKATQRALHEPFQFPSEVEGKLRELAENELNRIRVAIARLKDALGEMHRAAIPQPQIQDQRNEPLSDSEVHAMQRGGALSRQMLRMGLKQGWIDQNQLLPLDEHPIEESEND